LSCLFVEYELALARDLHAVDDAFVLDHDLGLAPENIRALDNSYVLGGRVMRRLRWGLLSDHPV